MTSTITASRTLSSRNARLAARSLSMKSITFCSGFIVDHSSPDLSNLDADRRVSVSQSYHGADAGAPARVHSRRRALSSADNPAPRCRAT